MQIIVYHGDGREIGERFGSPPVDRTRDNFLGDGFYVSEDPSIAEIFGENVTKYFFNFNPDEMLILHNDAELEKFIVDACTATGLTDFDKAIPQYAKSLGYKAIKGPEKSIPAIGINILDKSVLKEIKDSEPSGRI